MEVRRRLVGALLVGVGPLSVLALPSAAVAAEAADPCAGITGCHERVPTDVDGDGQDDRVGVVRDGEDGAAEGSITIRVETAAGGSARARRATEYWIGPAVHGYAALDSVKGQELVLGRATGAHTLHYQVLTWRDGDLVTLPAPGRFGWAIDGAASISLGWWRKATDPRGVLKQRYATLVEGGRRQWAGTVTTYRHRDGAWQKVSSSTRGISRERAGSWVGWRVPGLPMGY